MQTELLQMPYTLRQTQQPGVATAFASLKLAARCSGLGRYARFFAINVAIAQNFVYNLLNNIFEIFKSKYECIKQSFAIFKKGILK